MHRVLARALAAPAIAAVAAFFGTTVIGAQATEHLRIGGTGSALGGMHRLAEAFAENNPDVEVVVLPSLGSGGGIKALAADKIDLAVSARPMKPSEADSGLIELQYAVTPLVFATRPDTAVDGVGLADVERVYRGEATTWPDGSRLRLVMRPATEADTAALRAMSPEMDAAVEAAIGRENLFVAINDQDNAEALERIEGSLGLIALGQLVSEARELKPLMLDGKAGTMENVRTGAYAHTKALHIIRKPAPTPAAQRFLEFMVSEEGSRILSESGYLPTGAAEPRS